MARGIITVKPGNSGGSTTAGKIIVTDGSSGSSDGTTSTGGLSDSAASVGAVGTEVGYATPGTEKVGDLVNFSLSATGEVTIDSIIISGTEITSADEPVVVANGQSVVINGSVNAKVSVNGGYLSIVAGSRLAGKLESAVANSYVIAKGATVSAKVDFNAAGNFVLENCSVEGKVSSAGSTYTCVKNCNIEGSLDILNAQRCSASGNTVEGKTTTSPGCQA